MNQYLPGTVPTNPDERNRFLSYARDYSYPKHKVRWNFLVDFPFGKGKLIGHNAGGVLSHVIGGWQVAGLGALGSTYLPLTTSFYNFTGEPLRQYGYKYPLEDCRSGTCYPGYLWYNGYIPSSQINSHDEAGKPNGVMGVPAGYKPAVTPLIPWGSTAMPANAPAGTNVADFWDTNTVWVPLKDGTVVRTDYAPGLNPWQNQYIPGPLQWNQDLSLFKRFRLWEGTELRFNFDAFNVFNHPNNDPSGIWWDEISLDEIPAPPPRRVRIAAINLKPSKAAFPAETVSQFLAVVEREAPENTDVILLPEGITHVGTNKPGFAVAETVPGPTSDRLADLARRRRSYVFAGIYEREGTVLYNTALLIDRAGRIAGKYRKVYLPRDEVNGGFTPGMEYPVFTTDFGKVGIMICWDIQYADPARSLALGGAELILVPIWGGNETLGKARAIENHVFLASSGYDYPTCIMDPTGKVLAQAKGRGKAAIATIDLNRYPNWWDGEMRGRFMKEVRWICSRPDSPNERAHYDPF